MYSKTINNCYRKRSHRNTNLARAIAVMLIVLAILVAGYCKLQSRIQNGKFAEATEPTVANNTKIDNNTLPKTKTEVQSDSESKEFANEVTFVATDESEQKEEEIPQIYEGEFELPLEGATAYVMVDTELCDRSGGQVKKVLNAGDSLQIVGEEGFMLIVKTEDGITGFVPNYHCMLNLPDVIPSIVYRDTNSVESVFMSSGYELPNVTGEQLYNVEQYNERLGRNEFNMPIMFETAKKVMAAQKMALSEGYSLCIVETYRPLDTQKKVSESLKTLAASNEAVQNGITGNGWNESWFIAQKVSNHQRGYAMDVTLVEVTKTEVCSSGDYNYVNVAEYEEVQMPTQIHELSNASVALERGVKSSSETEWKSVKLAKTMNDMGIRLQNYCVEAGFTPLASEWWHFNDLSAMNSTGGSLSTGEYFLQANLSVAP